MSIKDYESEILKTFPKESVLSLEENELRHYCLLLRDTEEEYLQILYNYSKGCGSETKIPKNVKSLIVVGIAAIFFLLYYIFGLFS